VDVEVLVEGRNDSKAQQLLDKIDIRIIETSGLISFETKLRDNTNTNKDESFEINYSISLPAENAIIVENQFGDTFIGSRKGDSDLLIKFGNLKASDFKGKLKLNLQFGNGVIAETVDADVLIKYGELEMGNGKIMDMEQQFSEVNIGDFERLDLESKYGSFSMNTVGEITADVQFSEFEIEKINISGYMESNYASDFEVGILSKDASFFKFYGKFSQLSLGLDPSMKADLEADMSFCNLKDYSDLLNFYYESKEDTKKEYKAKIGGGDSNRKIVIKSSYGDAKIK
jgi:hypothetical protein